MLENFRLRVFREVASQASFRRAAEVLYITQPAVTQQIKALEEELGSRLFDRSGGRVRLTAAGEVLLRHASEAEATLSRAVEEIGSLEGEVRGALRVAASTTIAQYVLPRLLAEFARQHQGVQLELESANTQRVVEAVANGDAPIGLIEGPAHNQELVVERWLEDELVLVVPAGHEWADEEIALSALGSAKLLVRERGSGTREVIEQALKRAGAPIQRMQIAMELGSTRRCWPVSRRAWESDSSRGCARAAACARHTRSGQGEGFTHCAPFQHGASARTEDPWRRGDLRSAPCGLRAGRRDATGEPAQR